MFTEQEQCSSLTPKALHFFYHFIFTVSFYGQHDCYLYLINEQTEHMDGK